MVHVLADQHIYRVDEFVPQTAHLTLFDPQKSLSIPEDTDALLIRTTVELKPGRAMKTF